MLARLRALFHWLTRQTQSKCPHCLFWKRRHRDLGSCWKHGHEKLTFQHDTCVRWMPNCVKVNF